MVAIHSVSHSWFASNLRRMLPVRFLQLFLLKIFSVIANCRLYCMTHWQSEEVIYQPNSTCKLTERQFCWNKRYLFSYATFYKFFINSSRNSFSHTRNKRRSGKRQTSSSPVITSPAVPPNQIVCCQLWASLYHSGRRWQVARWWPLPLSHCIYRNYVKRWRYSQNRK